MDYENLFLTDRMLGVLTRYLRFMGYDTKSANSLVPGNPREDTILLEIAKSDGRYLLTRDRELSRRGCNDNALYLESDDVLGQLKQLFKAGLIKNPGSIGMHRCVLCNSPLRAAKPDEVKNASYAPSEKADPDFKWCPLCGKLYWTGTHSVNMGKRLKIVFDDRLID